MGGDNRVKARFREGMAARMAEAGPVDRAAGSDDDEAPTSNSASKSKGTDANVKAKRKSLRQPRQGDD
jgi:hypothetical protein